MRDLRRSEMTNLRFYTGYQVRTSQNWGGVCLIRILGVCRAFYRDDRDPTRASNRF